MRPSLLLLLVTLLLPVAMMGQEPDVSLTDRLALQRSLFPQEKVHVMTDRELYAPGDTVWMRAWVVEGERLMPLSLGSRYVYVELRDGLDTLRRCVKLRMREGRFVGQMQLPAVLQSGDYTLAAYTLYNLSASEELIFRKVLHVITPADAANGFTARALHEGTLPPADTLRPDSSRPLVVHRRDTLLRVSFPAPPSTWFAVSVTDDRLTPIDTTASLLHRLPAVPPLFTLQSVAADTAFYHPIHPIERRQVIRGLALNVGRQLRNRIHLIDIAKPAVHVTYTDAEGVFTFRDIEFSDSTVFILMGFTPANHPISDIRVANGTQPVVIHHLHADPHQYYVNSRRDQNTISEESNSDSKRQPSLSADAQTDKNLDKTYREILDPHSGDDIYTRLSSESRLMSTLSQYRTHELSDVIRKFDGIYIDPQGVAMYRSEGYPDAPVRFVIGSHEEPLQTDSLGQLLPQAALQYPVEVIYALDFILPAQADVIRRSDNPDSPIIRIDLKFSSELLYEASYNPFVKVHIPLGYTKPLLFPRLRVDPRPLATRYWNPEVFSGPDGRITLDLPVPLHRSTSYTLRAEGLTPDGQPVSLLFRLFPSSISEAASLPSHNSQP